MWPGLHRSAPLRVDDRRQETSNISRKYQNTKGAQTSSDWQSFLEDGSTNKSSLTNLVSVLICYFAPRVLAGKTTVAGNVTQPQVRSGEVSAMWQVRGGPPQAPAVCVTAWSSGRQGEWSRGTGVQPFHLTSPRSCRGQVAL